MGRFYPNRSFDGDVSLSVAEYPWIYPGLLAGDYM